MLRLPPFRYRAPKSIREAVEWKAAAGSEAAFVAGGTDLYPNMKRRQQTPREVIGLSRIRALQRVSFGADDVAIGAGVPLSRLEADPRIRRDYPGLAHAISTISTPPLRNMGTIGGNVLLDTRCNYYDQSYEWRAAIDFCLKKDGGVCWVAPGSPRCLAVTSADTVPVLIALGAYARLVSAAGEREVPLEGLYRNDGIAYLTKTPDELLVQIRLPRQDGWRASYRKLRRRGSFDFPVAGVGAGLRFEGGVVADARVVLTGVASAPLRLDRSEELLRGRPLERHSIEEAASAATALARPMDNTDFSFLWRREMTRRLVSDALRDLASDLAGDPGGGH